MKYNILNSIHMFCVCVKSLKKFKWHTLIVVLYLIMLTFVVECKSLTVHLSDCFQALNLSAVSSL